MSLPKSVIVGLIVVLGAVMPAGGDWDAANVAFASRDFANAAEQFSAVIARDPENPSYAGAYWMLGRCQLELDKAAEATASLARAVQLDGGKWEYRYSLGKALLADSKLDQAHAALQQITVDEVPEAQRTTVVLLQADVGLRAGHGEVVLAPIEQRLKADPSSAGLHRVLGFSLRETDRERAITEFGRAWELDHNQQTCARAAVQLALGLAEGATTAEETERWEKQAYELAVDLAQTAPDFRNAKLAGKAARTAGEHKVAAQWYSRAVEERPDDGEVSLDLGRTLVALEQYGKAQKILLRALAAEPGAELGPRMHRELARIAARQLELKGAAEEFRLAGDKARADEVTRIADSIAEVLGRRQGLIRKIAQLKELQASLLEISDTKGVDLIGQKLSDIAAELAAIDVNLKEVRTALRKL